MSSPDDDVQAWFDGLSKKVQRQLAGVVKREADALSAAQLARLRSLEKPPAETGDLEASCQVLPGVNEAQFVVVAGGEQTTADGYDHALGFEFGTVKQPAQSFFWSTYRERATDARQRIEDAIGEALK
jgi:hypothetical protein